MDEKTRIQKDIVMFEENIKKTEKICLRKSEKKILELAIQYYKDSKYYKDKKDFFTSFGCINYAHGLIDALIKF